MGRRCSVPSSFHYILSLSSTLPNAILWKVFYLPPLLQLQYPFAFEALSNTPELSPKPAPISACAFCYSPIRQHCLECDVVSRETSEAGAFRRRGVALLEPSMN